MKGENIDSEDFVPIIIRLLGLSKKAKPESSWEPHIPQGMHPDLLIKDGKEKYIVEISNTASLQKLAQLALYQRLLDNRKKINFVLAAKVIPTSIIETAKQVGIRVVTLPRDISIGPDIEKQRAKLTTEKAWKVCVRLIKERGCSIRQIALKEGISYGWTHATVKRLIARGIVKQRGNFVEIHDPNKLMDAVAWERPLKELEIGSFKTPFSTPYEAAETLSRTTKKWEMPIAFTSYTSASLYVGYAARHDSVYCYVLNKEAYLELKREVEDKEGTSVICYTPDRDVFKSAQERKKIMLVSLEQTLLDLAGLGYSARDFALELVKKYADIGTDNG
jgi:hypothetical protein